tara:strand:- start:73952 stop:74080 length:129 start_codon:yes stop_codon:yes gene_type:complete
MQKSFILFIILIIVITIAVLTETNVEHKNSEALIAQSEFSNN